ncbi:MAG: bifunctional nuclease family protein [Bacteroidetes bacterium]|nr:bifunctional nuclease family protein [Bacteroidota bacterium]
MKKIKVEIVGLSYSQSQSGAYALVLGEEAGARRLPIIIGGFEAQAIAIELEKMTPSRPLTHDLFKTFAEIFTITIEEVLIYNLVEGIFYAKLICSNESGKQVEIDARTSDAIAIAVRFKCPIYTYEFILKNAGILLDEDVVASTDSTKTQNEVTSTKTTSDANEFAGKSTEELNNLLQIAIDDEKYELASKIRDELNKRKKS